MNKIVLDKEISLTGQKFLARVEIFSTVALNDLYTYHVTLLRADGKIIGQRSRSSNDLLNLPLLVKWAIRDMSSELRISEALAAKIEQFEKWDGRIV
ncbi:MAG: hypothetical protein KH230_13655 [Enterocloster asparagiformis]|nr:hypothetical protein [Enterocloster asparagiformis]